ncbi:unnamed protein product [Pylaiella littoralis]
MKGTMLTRTVVLASWCLLSNAFIPAVVNRGAGNSAAVSVERHQVARRANAVLPLQQLQGEADVATVETVPEGSLVLIEVTKKSARVFKSIAKGSVPQVVEPVDAWRVHETSNREKRSQGQGKHHAEKPDPVADESFLVKFYMEELSEIIDAADSILLVGHGNAKSNIANVLAAALCERQPSLTDKIADVLRVDGKHITQNQLLKLGRRHLLHADDPRRPT